MSGFLNLSLFYLITYVTILMYSHLFFYVFAELNSFQSININLHENLFHAQTQLYVTD